MPNGRAAVTLHTVGCFQLIGGGQGFVNNNLNRQLTSFVFLCDKRTAILGESEVPSLTLFCDL